MILGITTGTRDEKKIEIIEMFVFNLLLAAVALYSVLQSKHLKRFNLENLPSPS